MEHETREMGRGRAQRFLRRRLEVAHLRNSMVELSHIQLAKGKQWTSTKYSNIRSKELSLNS